MFIVVDVTTGTTVYQHTLTKNPAWFFPGEIAVNSSGTLAVVTDPGKPLIDRNVGTIDIVDLTDLRLTKRFDEADLGPVQNNSQIVFTSDETAAIVSSIIGGSGFIHRIDLATAELVLTAYLPGDNTVAGAMVLGPSPQ